MLVEGFIRWQHESAAAQASINAHKRDLERKRRSIVKQKKTLDARVAARQEREGVASQSSAQLTHGGGGGGGGGFAAMMARQKADRFGLMPREAAKVSAGYGKMRPDLDPAVGRYMS